jgi:hypothetical protein
MLADIAQVASEHPDIDPGLIRALYQHLLMVQGHQPSIDEAREYIARLTSSVDEATLRAQLGLEVTRSEGPRTSPTPTAARGRPKGTRSVPREQIIDVYRTLRRNYGRAPTQAELASNLSPRIATRTLQAHLAAYGLPWPIE